MIVVTRSGTIGRVQIIPEYMKGWAGSEHATRLLSSNQMNPGYIFSWLASDYGKTLIKRHSYGSVILEIDKEMLGEIPIPLPEKEKQEEIGKLVLEANSLRDQAWRLEREGVAQVEGMISAA